MLVEGVGIFDGKRRANLDAGTTTTVDELVTQLSTLLSLSLSNVRVEVWDKEFEEWVCLDSVAAQLLPKSKLRLIQQEHIAKGQQSGPRVTTAIQRSHLGITTNPRARARQQRAHEQTA